MRPLHAVVALYALCTFCCFTWAAEKVINKQGHKDAHAIVRQDIGSGSLNSPVRSAPLEPMLSPDLFSGILNMQIPIDVPKGRNGVQPNLALQYQSGDANGPIGVGWRLEPGVIQRDPSFGAADACDESTPLNACYLISLQGARYPIVRTQEGTYAARQEGRFLRIRKREAAAGGDEWEITDKKGTRYLFGEQPASRQVGAYTFKWLLDRVADTNGNYMTFSYQNDGFDVYLSQIDYTGHDQDIRPNLSVTFDYEPREDFYYHYEFGASLATSRRLKWITTKANGVTIKKYELKYVLSSQTYRSVLSEIMVYGSDGTTVSPSIHFQSKQFSNGWWFEPLPWGAGPSPAAVIRKQCLQGDYNGDGRMDIACYTQQGQLWHVALSTSVGWNTTYWPSGPSPGDDVSSNCLTGDFNADGNTDIACYTGSARWVVALSDGSKWLSAPWSDGPAPAGSVQDRCLAGDFEGLGKTGIACWTTADTWHVALSNGVSWSSSSDWKDGPSPNSLVWKKCLTLEAVGDGKTQIACTEGDGAWVVARPDNGHWTHASWSGPKAQVPLGYCFVGDYNSDGLQDLLCYKDRHWTVGLSTGSSFTIKDWGTDPAIDYSYCVQGDFNGDSKTDLACYNVKTWKWTVALSTGSRLIPSPGYSTFPSPIFTSFGCFVGDVIGNGKTDLVCFTESGNWTVTTPVFDPPDILATVIHPFGAKTDLEYQDSTQTPNSKIPFNVKLISQVSNATSPIGPTYVTRFKFDGGRYIRHKREFRGFGHVRVIEPSDLEIGGYKDYWFNQGAAFGIPDAAEGLVGKLKSFEVSDPQGTLLQSIGFSYQLGSDVAPYFTPLSDVATTFYGGTSPSTTLTQYSYDQYGNVIQETRTDQTKQTLVTTRRYLADEKSWIVGLPISEANFGDLRKKDCLRQADLTYDANGNVTRIVRWSSVPNLSNPETKFEYDRFGNMITQWDPRGNVKHIDYDNRFFTFPTALHNAIGQTFYLVFAGVNSTPTDTWGPYGSIVRTVDLNLQSTKFKYDALGRLILAIGPELDETEWDYQFGPSFNRIQVTLPGKTISNTYLDGFGRVTRQDIDGPSGRRIVSDRVYDHQGFVARTTIPHFSDSENLQWNEVYRDPLGRVVAIVQPDNTRTLFCRKGLSATVIDPNGHWKNFRFDGDGHVIGIDTYSQTAHSCSDAILNDATPQSEVSYVWDGVGQLQKASDVADNNIRFAWDSLGHVRTIDDPDRGNLEFDYDLSGNLLTSTDARGEQIIWTYDELNRPLTKSSGRNNKSRHLLVSFGYDSALNGNGLLSNVRERFGTTDYSYDVRGRLARIVQRNSGKTLGWSKTYEQLGRLDSITYPSGIGVKYEYDGPFASGVVLDGKRLQSTLFNAIGEPIEVVQRQSIITHYQYYDGTTARCRLVTLRLCGIDILRDGVPIRSLSYAYDRKGNVISHTYDKTQLTLTYDFVDRVTDTTSGNAREHFSYDGLGNMSLNADIGDYSYGVKPHAVIKAGTAEYRYDSSGNEIFAAGQHLAYDSEGRLASLSTPGAASSQSFGASSHSQQLKFQYGWTGDREVTLARRNLPLPIRWFVPWKKSLSVGNLYACQNRKCTSFVYSGGKLISAVGETGQIDYIYTDLLSSNRLVLDNTGTVQSSTDYKAFGTPAELNGNRSLEYKFNGQWLDTSSGLYYYKARFYDPRLGRFVSPDPSIRLRDGQDFDPYSYVRNNPQSKIDPMGLWENPPDNGGSSITSPEESGWNVTPMSILVAQMLSMYVSNMTPLWRAGAMIRGDSSPTAKGERGSAQTTTANGLDIGPTIYNASIELALGIGQSRASLSIFGQLFVDFQNGLAYYPPHLTVILPAANNVGFAITASVGLDVGAAHGDVHGASKWSQSEIYGLGSRTVSASWNETFVNRTISAWGPEQGIDVGHLLAPSYTYSILTEPITTQDVEEALEQFILQMNDYRWAISTFGNVPYPQQP